MVKKVTRVTMYQGSEYDLEQLEPTDKLRKELEAELESSVQHNIATARQEGTSLIRKHSVTLLLNSMQTKPTQWMNSFAVWTARRGRLIGVKNCHKIGMDVCRTMNFTIAEAKKTLSETSWDSFIPRHSHHSY